MFMPRNDALAIIQDFMSEQESDDYGYAASLAAANEPSREAWKAGVDALRNAEERAISQFVGPVRLNRHRQPYGGVHPALAPLAGYFSLRGVYAPE